MSEIPPIKYHNRIRELRNEQGLTLRELEQKVGIKYNTLSLYENEKRKPSAESADKLARFFNVDTLYLLGHSNIRVNEIDALERKITSADLTKTAKDILIDLLGIIYGQDERIEDLELEIDQIKYPENHPDF